MNKESRPFVEILGIDPGLSTFGAARLRAFGPKDLELVAVEFFGSKPSPKKRRVRAVDDHTRRLMDLGEFLEPYLASEGLCLVVAEAMSYPPKASVTAKAKMASVYGVVCEASRRAGVPYFQVTPQEIKKALVGRHDGSKDEIFEAVQDLFPRFMGWPSTKSKIPHCADAVGAAYTGLSNEIVGMALRMILKE